MATMIETKNGKKIMLLNPAEKGKRYAWELQYKQKHTGEPLNAAQAGFRMGYLSSRTDGAKVYCAKKGIKSKAKPRKSK
jgi:hypothetical protein